MSDIKNFINLSTNFAKNFYLIIKFIMQKVGNNNVLEKLRLIDDLTPNDLVAVVMGIRVDDENINDFIRIHMTQYLSRFIYSVSDNGLYVQIDTPAGSAKIFDDVQDNYDECFAYFLNDKIDDLFKLLLISMQRVDVFEVVLFQLRMRVAFVNMNNMEGITGVLKHSFGSVMSDTSSMKRVVAGSNISVANFFNMIQQKDVGTLKFDIQTVHLSNIPHFRCVASIDDGIFKDYKMKSENLASSKKEGKNIAINNLFHILHTTYTSNNMNADVYFSKVVKCPVCSKFVR